VQHEQAHDAQRAATHPEAARAQVGAEPGFADQLPRDGADLVAQVVHDLQMIIARPRAGADR
jgi:hypothetical protein